MWQCGMTFIKGDVKESFAALLCRCLCLSCLPHLLWMTAKPSDNHSVLNVCEKARDRGRELSATLANHLIGWHTELTFEGYGSISPEMKKRDEREREGERRRKEIGYAASVLWSRQPLSMHLSIHPHHTTSSPLWSPPTPVLLLLLPSLTLSPSPSRLERRGRKDRDERKKKEYSRGRATGGWMNA